MMRILVASPREVRTEVVAAELSPAGAVATVLLVLGTHFDEPKSKAAVAYSHTVNRVWPLAEETLLKYAGVSKRKYLRQVKQWADAPPKTPQENDAKEDLILDFIANVLVKPTVDKITKDTSLNDAQLGTMLASIAWFKNGSNTAFLRLRKSGSAAGIPTDVLSLLAAEAESQEGPARQLAALLKKAGYAVTPGLKITPDECAAWKTRKPEEYKRYLALRKELMQAFHAELMNYCRTREGPQPVAEVRRHFQAQGFVVAPLPEHFQGLVGEDGKLYTVAGKELSVKTGMPVKMNPNYDPQEDNGYVFTYIPVPGADAQYAFTLEYKAKKRAQKFAVARDLAANLDKIQKKYRADLRSTDAEKRTLATMLELQYITAMRVGNPGNATKNADGTKEPTYGLSTLQVKHIRKRGAGFLIMFPGKSAVEAKYTIQPVDPVLKLVVKNLGALLLNSEGGPKAMDEYVFKDKSGHYNSDRVNKYFRAVSGIAKATSHKIRHMRGTVAAEEIMKDAPKRLDQRAAEKWFLEAMTKVGALLNHVKGVGSDKKVTPATAIKNYIDPELSLSFFRERGLRIPKFLTGLM